MSTDYYVACSECKEYVETYVGSYGLSGFHSLVNNDKFKEEFHDFLRKHLLCGGEIKVISEHRLYVLEEETDDK